jgi:hypothetical protein
MHSALYRQPNAQYQLYMNIKGVSPSCFGTSIPSLGRKKCQFLEPTAKDELLFTWYFSM